LISFSGKFFHPDINIYKLNFYGLILCIVSCIVSPFRLRICEFDPETLLLINFLI